MDENNAVVEAAVAEAAPPPNDVSTQDAQALGAGAETAATEAGPAVEPSPLLRKLALTVDKNELAEAKQKALRSIGRTAKVTGFRPGKLPPKILEKYYGHDAHERALNQLIDKSWQAAIKEHGFDVVGEPQIKMGEGTETQLVFDAEFEVKPEITLPDFSQWQLERRVYQLSSEDVDKTLARMRRQAATLVAADRPAMLDDEAIVGFVGRIDGDVFEGGSSESQTIVLGRKQMLPEFEAAIVGMVVGESRSVSLVFPDNYPEHLRGKTAVFDITLSELKAPQLPEVDEAFVRSMGIESGSLDDLRHEIEQNLRREVSRRLAEMNRNEAYRTLLNDYADLPLPRSMIFDQVRNRVNGERDRLAHLKLSDNEFASRIDINTIVSECTIGVRLHLLTEKLVAQFGSEIQPSLDDVRALIREEASAYEIPEEVEAWYFAETDRLREPYQKLFDRRLVDRLFSLAQVREKTLSFEEVVG